MMAYFSNLFCFLAIVSFVVWLFSTITNRDIHFSINGIHLDFLFLAFVFLAVSAFLSLARIIAAVAVICAIFIVVREILSK